MSRVGVGSMTGLKTEGNRSSQDLSVKQVSFAQSTIIKALNSFFHHCLTGKPGRKYGHYENL